MATWKQFEDMDVWEQACRLVCEIYDLTREEAVSRDFAFRDQIRRSALSVPSNIAEGFERQSDRAFANFLDIAKGSCGELRTQLYIAVRLDHVSADRATALIEEARRISRMLSGLIKHLRPAGDTPRKEAGEQPPP